MLTSHAHWNPLTTLSTPMPNAVAAWLVDSKELSPIFKTLCHALTVHRLKQAWEPCFADETVVLELQANDPALVREVYLLGDGIAWSFGRVVIPEATYQHWQTQFDELGTRPIGEHLLYSNESVVRSNFTYCQLGSEHPLYQTIHRNYPCPTPTLWARRSLFTIDDQYPLLISDIMLPNAPEYPHHG